MKIEEDPLHYGWFVLAYWTKLSVVFTFLAPVWWVLGGFVYGPFTS